MPEPNTIRTNVDFLGLDWQDRHLREMNYLATCVAILAEQVKSTTLWPDPDAAIVAPLGYSLSTVGNYFQIQPDICFGYRVWEPTLPLRSELDTVEICIDPENLEMDLSLLDEKERRFFENFVGAFKPGPNFTEEDLEVDDIF